MISKLFVFKVNFILFCLLNLPSAGRASNSSAGGASKTSAGAVTKASAGGSRGAATTVATGGAAGAGAGDEAKRIPPHLLVLDIYYLLVI